MSAVVEQQPRTWPGGPVAAVIAVLCIAGFVMGLFAGIWMAFETGRFHGKRELLETPFPTRANLQTCANLLREDLLSHISQKEACADMIEDVLQKREVNL